MNDDFKKFAGSLLFYYLINSENSNIKQISKKRAKSFNIPVDLIKRIDENADRKTGGNRSALIINILEERMTLD